jgi:hypothetical protein
MRSPWRCAASPCSSTTSASSRAPPSASKCENPYAQTPRRLAGLAHRLPRPPE